MKADAPVRVQFLHSDSFTTQPLASPLQGATGVAPKTYFVANHSVCNQGKRICSYFTDKAGMRTNRRCLALLQSRYAVGLGLEH